MPYFTLDVKFKDINYDLSLQRFCEVQYKHNCIKKTRENNNYSGIKKDWPPQHKYWYNSPIGNPYKVIKI